MAKERFLHIPAIAFQQSEGRTLFTFAVEGSMLHEFATVSRIARREDDKIYGYQRPEVASHIANIANYLVTKGSMLPNAIVVAFDDVVEFLPSLDSRSEGANMGILKIPIMAKGQEGTRKPAWIVDGQQRAAALTKAGVSGFMVCVVGFIASNDAEQREQFMLVNSAKPLAKSLLYELLPQTNCLLPASWERKRLPSDLLTLLNLDKRSPFYARIKTATNPNGIIQDNSVLRMLENSLSDGALYVIQERYAGQAKVMITQMLEVLNHYWEAVARTFPSAWNLPPKKSRLTHGAGIISLGFIMDAIADRQPMGDTISVSAFQQDLSYIVPACKWTHGFWELGPGDQRKWNEVQNTPTDIRILSNYLLVQYKSLVWSEALRAS
ncbi:DGQHR domain-containing protein DpdB [Hymenobacter sp. BT559]|uniref:DGQHR domain-containing protein DpdB n=1 Tax=Hymenobacter sp. BT559 TaxID=2795729 RepID=UPI0018EA88B7|nr:DGQHR domain-containing protein DpdB [Hymenobacter sp. BT559]MBJ6146296.1 DGQHR domain-containing protein [Hymenobacter sp. BT559]